MKKTITFLLLILLPMCIYSQSEAEIRLSVKACDYESVIRQILPENGDTLFTPLRAQALEAMNRFPEATKEWNSLLDKDSTRVDVLMELAKCYKTTSRHHQATLCLQVCIDSWIRIHFRIQHIELLYCLLPKTLLHIRFHRKGQNRFLIRCNQVSS